MTETQKGAVNQICTQLPATLERVMTSKDYHYDKQLLGSGSLDEPVFALVDVVARIAAADAGGYAFLDDTEATSAESLLTRSSEDPMARLKGMPPVIQAFMWRFARRRNAHPCIAHPSPSRRHS